jgi:hypothetical protein
VEQQQQISSERRRITIRTLGRKRDPQNSLKGWREDLGPTTTEKDLEKFAKKSEETAFKRYGKDWDYIQSKGGDQKKFADMIKKGENEIVKRMKKK